MEQIYIKKLLLNLILILTVLSNVNSKSPPTKPGTGSDKRLMFVQVLTGNFQSETPESRSKEHTMPDMTRVSKECPKKAFYFAMNPVHMDAVGEVTGVLRS